MLLRARTQKGPRRTAAILHGEAAAKAQRSLCGSNTYPATLPRRSPPRPPTHCQKTDTQKEK